MQTFDSADLLLQIASFLMFGRFPDSAAGACKLAAESVTLVLQAVALFQSTKPVHVFGMQKLMGGAAEGLAQKLFVGLLYLGVLMGEAKLSLTVQTVQVPPRRSANSHPSWMGCPPPPTQPPGHAMTSTKS